MKTPATPLPQRLRNKAVIVGRLYCKYPDDQTSTKQISIIMKEAADEITKLMEEREKLREALEHIAMGLAWNSEDELIAIAQTTLASLEKSNG